MKEKPHSTLFPTLRVPNNKNKQETSLSCSVLNGSRRMKVRKEGWAHICHPPPASRPHPRPMLAHPLFVHKAPTKWQILCSPTLTPFGKVFSARSWAKWPSCVPPLCISTPDHITWAGLWVFFCPSYQWTNCVLGLCFSSSYSVCLAGMQELFSF